MPSLELPVVCFDLGGVLAQITHSWDEAILRAGVGEVPGGGPHGLNSFEPLIRYQAGELDEEVFLSELGTWLQAPLTSDAQKIHRSILIEDYPGALNLVQDLNRVGVFTCCFSNTNALHWPILTSDRSHPAVAALQRKFASHEIGMAKPDVASFRFVESHFPEHDRVIFFDDYLENVYGAAEAGWEAFKIDAGSDTPAEMRRIIWGLGVVPNV